MPLLLLLLLLLCPSSLMPLLTKTTFEKKSQIATAVCVFWLRITNGSHVTIFIKIFDFKSILLFSNRRFKAQAVCAFLAAHRISLACHANHLLIKIFKFKRSFYSVGVSGAFCLAQRNVNHKNFQFFFVDISKLSVNLFPLKGCASSMRLLAAHRAKSF